MSKIIYTQTDEAPALATQSFYQLSKHLLIMQVLKLKPGIFL